MIKKIIIAAVIVAVVGLVLIFARGPEDAWLCANGLWVKHGAPAGDMPEKICGEALDKEIEITVTKPLVSTSPFVIFGRAKGSWFFEASFPIKLLDLQGKQIAASYVQAKTDWMTSGFVDFEGEIVFDVSNITKAMLVLIRDNPSGLPENDEAVSLPVVLLPTEKIKVKVFFNNNNLDPEISCNKVFSVEREILKTQAVARAAIDELLKGATNSEQEQGFFTSVNSGVEIQSLVIENNIAKVDFNEQLQFQVGGSCRVSAIRAQIIETLKQFSTVNEVVISINGRSEDILQP